MNLFGWQTPGAMCIKSVRVFAVFAVCLTALTSVQFSVKAQVAPVIQPGFKAVTSFSGTHIPGIDQGLPAGVNPVDETLINLENPSLRIFDTTNLADKARGQLVYTPKPFEVKAGQVGQVFGLAYDDGKGITGSNPGTPNLYATATTLYGVQIVENDLDGDGRPERLKQGKPGAQFMAGQFGPNNAGPGAIWKIDGNSGNVTLFAQIPGNSGGGLGNIAFDQRSRQLFVSDLDTGKIHRLSMDGRVLDAYDHGVVALPLQGFAPFPDDGQTMDITNPAFNPENPETWGYTQEERRVWGVGVWRNRLYYAVGKRAQIWSVGIAADGSFANDAQLELKVSARADLPVTDIAFDNKGLMYLAQRGLTINMYDYFKLAQSEQAEVLRYVAESPDDPSTPGKWQPVPDTYATGFSGDFRQTTGGIDLQYGYDEDGVLNPNKCTQTLFKTGDNLMQNPSLVQLVNNPAPNIVHGTQLTDTKLVRPANEPPFGSWFFDVDGFYDDPKVRGHMGDVEVWRPCANSQSHRVGKPGIRFFYDHIPGFNVKVKKDQCLEVDDVYFSCHPNGDLIADFYMGAPAVPGANTLQTRVPTPGIKRWPLRQTRRRGTQPFSVRLRNTFPGDPVTFDFCIYDGNAAKIPGVSFPCCKAKIQVNAPNFVCK